MTRFPTHVAMILSLGLPLPALAAGANALPTDKIITVDRETQWVELATGLTLIPQTADQSGDWPFKFQAVSTHIKGLDQRYRAAEPD